MRSMSQKREIEYTIVRNLSQRYGIKYTIVRSMSQGCESQWSKRGKEVKEGPSHNKLKIDLDDSQLAWHCTKF